MISWKSKDVYRSPTVRWIFVLVGYTISCVLFFGDPNKWFASDSLLWLHKLAIPLWFWAAAMALYASLLIPDKTRAIGYALGTALYAVIAVALIWTIGKAGPKNIFAVGAVIDVAAFHAFAVRSVLTTRERAKVGL